MRSLIQDAATCSRCWLAGGERTSGSLARDCGWTKPAASQHLKVLREAGLVEVRTKATVCSTGPGGKGSPTCVLSSMTSGWRGLPCSKTRSGGRGDRPRWPRRPRSRSRAAAAGGIRLLDRREAAGAVDRPFRFAGTGAGDLPAIRDEGWELFLARLTAAGHEASRSPDRDQLRPPGRLGVHGERRAQPGVATQHAVVQM